MIPISIKNFAKKTAKQNKDINEKELIKSLKEALEAKKNGASVVSVDSRSGWLEVV